jgi:hypothetical protein
MLSTLPKLADKAFILGFFLPTFLFVLAVAALYHDQPWAQTILDAATKNVSWDNLAYFVVAVWGVSVLLMMINDLQLKILEGYRWPVSKMSFLRHREEARFQQMKNSADELTKQWKIQDDAFPDSSKRDLAKLLRELAYQFPRDPSNQLPTRLGNAIRAFEVYSGTIYGAESIPLWLHLSTVISSSLQSTLDDARAQVNCAVNICFFAVVISLAAAISFVVGFHLKSLGTVYTSFAAMLPILHTSGFWFFAWMIGAAIVSRAAYLFSIQMVYPWGDLVKAAFDCYLPDLAKKMGFELPEDADRRKAFWIAVSRQAVYWSALKPEEWKPPAKEPPVDDQGGPTDQFSRLVTSIIRDM